MLQEALQLISDTKQADKDDSNKGTDAYNAHGSAEAHDGEVKSDKMSAEYEAVSADQVRPLSSRLRFSRIS